jgi:uncharacterized membrane protein YhaH (DUF805 family)/cold shock CspA family protein
MRGEVLHYDDDLGVGFITGEDQQRYGFERSDMRRLVLVVKGTRVEFRPDNGRARDIFVLHGVGPTGPQISGQSPQRQQFGRSASFTQAAVEDTGLWSYFIRTLTTNYANFHGRARRKEYWGFVLFLIISFIVVIGVGVFADISRGFPNGGEDFPIFSVGLAGIFWLATFIPQLALTVRRQHDIGLSGWFYLLVLIPYIGGLIIFIFTLIPSQPHDNQWGPVPYGVRVRGYPPT